MVSMISIYMSIYMVESRARAKELMKVKLTAMEAAAALKKEEVEETLR